MTGTPAPAERERVRLVAIADRHTGLHPGAEGTVLGVDDLGTVHVRWDNGVTLGLVPEADEWVPLCTRCGDDLAPGCCVTVCEPGWDR